MKLNKHSIFYSAAILMMSYGALQILGFTYRIELARMIGEQGLGVLQLTFSVYNCIMSVAVTGVAVAATNLSAAKYGNKLYSEVNIIINLCVKFFLILFFALALPTFFSVDFIANNILKNSGTKLSIELILICMLFTGFENIFKSAFYGMKYLKAPITSEISEMVVRIIAVAVIYYLYKPVSSELKSACVVVAMIISEMASSAILFVYLKTHSNLKSNLDEKPQLSVSALMPILLIWYPIAASGILNNFLGSINTILIPVKLVEAGLTEPAALAVLGKLTGMTIPLVTIPAMFIGAINTSVVPRIIESYAAGDMANVKRRVSKSLHATALLGFPTLAVIIPLASHLCVLMYKNESASQHILPLAVAGIFTFFQIISGSILIGIGKQKKVAVHIFIGISVQLIFTYCLTSNPKIKIMGFIIGFIASAVLMAVLNIAVLLKTVKIKFKFYNWIVAPFMCSLVVLFVCEIVTKILEPRMSNLPLCLLCILVSMIVYDIVLKLIKIDFVRYIKKILFC